MVGKLTWGDGILKFEGNAEESAKELMKYLAQYSGFTFLDKSSLDGK